MKSFALLVLVCVAALAVYQRYSLTDSVVNWEKDFSAALKASAETGRPVLINFSSVGCTYCRQMEAEVYPDPGVLAELAKFVPVKVDAFADEMLSARYDVAGLPGYVVVDAGGKVLARSEGYQSPENFIRFLKRAETAAGP